MTVYTPPIRRRNYGNSHGYVDAANRKVPSVTAIIRDGVPKPGLISWSANTGAAYAIDNWDDLSMLTPNARYWQIAGAWRRELSAAAVRGTVVHTYLPRLLAGEAIDAPEHLSGYLASLVRFMDEWDVRLVLAEQTVISYAHGYSGTFDLIADVLDPDGFGDRERWLIDGKTSNSGVYGETALQLAAYRYAEVYSEYPDGETPLPAVERTGVLHIREDGYDLVPVEAGPDQLRYFLAAKQVAEFRASADDLIGDPLTPPPSTADDLLEVFA